MATVGSVFVSGVLCFLLLIGSVCASPNDLPNLSLGHEYDLRGRHEDFLLPDPLVDPSIAPDHPLYVRIRVPWHLFERQEGIYRWRDLDTVVDSYLAANYIVCLNICGNDRALGTDGSLGSFADPTFLKRWLGFVRAVALHFKSRVRYYEVWDMPNRESRWSTEHVADYAYLLKNSSVTIRSADPDSLIVQGGIALGEDTLDSDLEWQSELYRQDVAPYVDVLSIHPSADLPFGSTLSRVHDLVLSEDPSAQLWVTAVSLSGKDARAQGSDLLKKFIVGHGEGASMVTFSLQAAADRGPQFQGVILDLHKLFIPTFSSLYGETVRFEMIDETTAGFPEGIRAYKFFDADTFQGLIGFFAPSSGQVGKARMIIDTAAVRGLAMYDIIGGAAGPIRGGRADYDSNTTEAPVVVRDRPLIVQYARVPIDGFEIEKEKLQVSETGLITVEEILVNHQRFMADQDFRLRTYRADGRVIYHYSYSGVTIDVQSDNNFYWDRKTGAEWEQREIYFNGVRWKHKRPPQLPFLQPEKVVTLPLDINLNKDYSYEYIGLDKVGEYECYVLSFKPVNDTMSLYRGRVWIETRTFARIKVATVQTNLAPPSVSNEERDLYAPFVGPDGTTYWLLTRVEGQQIFTVAGRNLVLNREIDLEGFQINDGEFEEARQLAYRSDRQMIRDTPKGLRYLEKTDSGDRSIKSDTTKSTLFGVAGVFVQPGFDRPVPLAGINYFDYRFRNKDIQLNAFLAGLLNTFTLTNPSMFGRKIDATIEALTLIPSITDRAFVRGEESEESNVDARFQDFSGSLGVPIGNFFRVRGTYGLQYVNYSRDEETNTFVPPSDTWIHSISLAWEFNRHAWTVTATGRRSHRTTWDPWGDSTLATDPEVLEMFPSSPCNTPGSCFDEFDPRQDSYDQYQFTVSKQFFLPLFQKLRFEGSWYNGSHLDRFSEYQFSFFGTRVRGLSGSGVRFDKGGIWRAQYAFNLGDVVRFSASLDSARVKDTITSADYYRHTGFGISGSLLGPWQTIIQFDVGVAIQSDFDELEGDTEAQIVLLRFF